MYFVSTHWDDGDERVDSFDTLEFANSIAEMLTEMSFNRTPEKMGFSVSMRDDKR